jgi:hypothetical protein
MKFRIHYTLPDGSEDSIIISGQTIEDIRKKAAIELKNRGGEDPLSEELE